MIRRIFVTFIFLAFYGGAFAMDAPTNSAPAPIPVAAPSPAMAPTPTATVATPPAAPTPGANAPAPRVYRSIMFSDKNIDDIFKILPRLRAKISSPRGIGSDIFEQFDFGDTSAGGTITMDESSISVYLNSIMYISKNSWSVWLNGSKITNLNNGDGEISVTEISPLKASFVWNMGLSRWNIINATNQVPEFRYKIDGDQVSLYFSLSPNQTYLPAVNKIVEGRVVQKPASGEDAETQTQSSENNSRSDLYF